jgi:ribosomal protein S18 acetylase RimI-like enzyme
MYYSLQRFVHYLGRYGVHATVRRIVLSWQHLRTGTRWLVYFCDLREAQPVDVSSLAGGRVERKNTLAQVPPDDLSITKDNWNSVSARNEMDKRFKLGASLWEFKIGEKIAGYGWTVAARTIDTPFFPLGQEDVFLFDFFVYPEFRGRRINPLLVNYILAQLASEKKGRAFLETAEWNTQEQSSLRRTPFLIRGKTRKCQLFGRTLVLWSKPPISPE